MANMLMDGDLVLVTYRDRSRFQGLVQTTLGRQALIQRPDNACVIEFTCMDGANWKDEQGHQASVEVVTIDQFVKRIEKMESALAWFERIEAAMAVRA